MTGYMPCDSVISLLDNGVERDEEGQMSNGLLVKHNDLPDSAVDLYVKQLQVSQGFVHSLLSLKQHFVC